MSIHIRDIDPALFPVDTRIGEQIAWWRAEGFSPMEALGAMGKVFAVCRPPSWGDVAEVMAQRGSG